MTESPTEARCPKCLHMSAAPVGQRAFFCFECKLAFEPEDDGTVSYGDPSKIVARKDDYQFRQKQRKCGR